jgi:hypothetical protein
MGATRRSRGNPLAENLLPPDADAYRSYLETVPRYSLSSS